MTLGALPLGVMEIKTKTKIKIKTKINKWGRLDLKAFVQ